MPSIEKDLEITHVQAGSLFLVMSVGLFTAQIFSGFLSSRINHKGSLFVSTLGLAVPLLLIYFVTDLWAIRGALFILGMAAGIHMPSAIPTITAMVNRQDWGKALGVHGTAPPMSLFIGPFLAIFLFNWYSWQTILLIIGIVAIIVSFSFLRFCPCGKFPGEPPRPALLKIVFTEGSFWIMVVLFALFLGNSIGIYTMLPLYLVNDAGFHEDLANSIVGLSRISGLFMTFLSGMLMDRIGEKKHMMIILVAAGISTILMGMFSGKWLVAIIFIQAAIIGSFPTAGFSALARIVQPNLRSVVSSFTTPISFLIGGGIVPTLIGYMGQVYSFSIGIITVGSLLILAALLVIPLQLIGELEEGC